VLPGDISNDTPSDISPPGFVPIDSERLAISYALSLSGKRPGYFLDGSQTVPREWTRLDAKRDAPSSKPWAHGTRGRHGTRSNPLDHETHEIHEKERSVFPRITRIRANRGTRHNDRPTGGTMFLGRSIGIQSNRTLFVPFVSFCSNGSGLLAHVSKRRGLKRRATFSARHDLRL
jgi:hypothetical protein